jgi:ABC-type sugar transport system permease subunit
VRLTLARVNPWSAAKLSFLLSVALGIIAVVAVAVLWSVVDAMGVFSDVQGVIHDVVGSEGSFKLMDYVGFSRVLSVTVFLAVVDVILLTIISTLAAVLYNLASSLVGGVRLTLSDD